MSYYVTAGNPAKLNKLTNLTITCWANLRGNPAANDRFVDKLGSGAGFGLAFNNASATAPQLAFLANGGGGVSPKSDGQNIFTTSMNNRWVFVAVTYDGVGVNTTSNVAFYTGGQYDSISQLGDFVGYNRGAIVNTANDFRVGSSPATTADRTPPVWIDDVRVYDAVLTSNELEQIRLENIPANTPAVIQPPQDVFVFQGRPATFNCVMGSPVAVSYQWLFNGAEVDGATNSSLTLSNVTLEMAGHYNLSASNEFGSVISSNALLTVYPVQATAQMTNLWNLLPGETPYLGTGDTERGLAFDSITTNLLLVSRASEPANVVVIDPATGATKFLLNNSGIASSITGKYLGLNQIGVGAGHGFRQGIGSLCRPMAGNRPRNGVCDAARCAAWLPRRARQRRLTLRVGEAGEHKQIFQPLSSR